MFLHHDNIDGASILEGEEAEATGAARGTIAHNRTLEHFSKLREVLLQGFWWLWLVKLFRGNMGSIDETYGPWSPSSDHQ